jgi:hypothetical protein
MSTPPVYNCQNELGAISFVAVTGLALLVLVWAIERIIVQIARDFRTPEVIAVLNVAESSSEEEEKEEEEEEEETVETPPASEEQPTISNDDD